MDPHERATSVWYRVAGLLRRGEPIEIARQLRERAERTIRPKPDRH
jgi:hypothetical protein